MLQGLRWKGSSMLMKRRLRPLVQRCWQRQEQRWLRMRLNREAMTALQRQKQLVCLLLRLLQHQVHQNQSPENRSPILMHQHPEQRWQQG